jgi:hypothetical protein
MQGKVLIKQKRVAPTCSKGDSDARQSRVAQPEKTTARRRSGLATQRFWPLESAHHMPAATVVGRQVASEVDDFANPASVIAWAATDGRVMGGLSSSRLRHDGLMACLAARLRTAMRVEDRYSFAA